MPYLKHKTRQKSSDWL